MALSEEERVRLFSQLTSQPGSPPASQMAKPLCLADEVLEGEVDYTIIFDGGSQGNPGPGYGSYALVRECDQKQEIVRLDFGRQMTNNEAEYEALIVALEGLVERVQAAGLSPEELTVQIRGDSALVIRQVEGTWKARDERMRMRRNRVRGLLAAFKTCRLVLQRREETVRVLGH